MFTIKARLFHIFVLTSLLAALTAGSTQAQGTIIIYVDLDANGTGDGTSWTDAYTDLQPASLM